MKFSLPGPTDVVNAMGSLRDGLGAALDLVPRLTAVIGQVEGLLSRVDAVVGSIEVTAGRADAVVDRVDKMVGRVEGTICRAEAAVAGTQGLVNRVDPLLTAYEPPLRRLAPTVTRVVGTIDAQEVEAIIMFVDRLPRLVAHLDDDILPMLRTLDRVGPDIHDLLEVAQDVRKVITGLPGMGLLRKRGDDEVPRELTDRS
ncbi:hypothetical protein BH20ACT5_BH20ACT5_14230 [soil metagenome]